MSAKEASEKLMKERGFLVVGFPPNTRIDVIPGDSLRNFAGCTIPGKLLVITGTATWKDWQAQVDVLGMKNPYQKEAGQRFFRAITEDER